MRKHCTPFLVLAVMLALLTGCRGNVSDREDGKITEPTSFTATMPTIATMPSTDTAPIDTMPSAETEGTNETQHTQPNPADEVPGMSDATNPSDTSEPEGQEGLARHAHPRDPMHRN